MKLDTRNLQRNPAGVIALVVSAAAFPLLATDGLLLKAVAGARIPPPVENSSFLIDQPLALEPSGSDANTPASLVLNDWLCTPSSPSPFMLPSVSIGFQLPPAGAQGYEVSGVVWHPRLNKLFTVHDGNADLAGSVTMLNLDGTGVQNWAIGGDFEGVSLADPNTNFVYLAKEEPNDSILEFDFVQGRVTKTWDLTNLSNCTSGCEVDGVPFPDPPGNSGIEAIAFVPDAGPSGGVFYLGLQSDGRIYRVRVDLSSTTGKYQYLGHAARLGPWNGAGGTSIQGLDYDYSANVLWAMIGQERVRVMRPDGSLLSEWTLPEPDGTIEGIAFASDSCEFFVGWDDFEGGPQNRLRRYGFVDCTSECTTTCGTAADCDDGNVCTTDACVSNVCQNTNNTLSCNDNNACTTSDVCSGGVCVGGAVLNCNDGNVCTTDSCNPANGCVHANNTVACNDSNACTTSDVCSGGVCVGGAVLNCNDGNVCTTDSCVPASGCQHVNNAAACNDNVACTSEDVCSSGVCNGTSNCPVGQTCNLSTGLCDGGGGTSLTFRNGLNGYGDTQDTYIQSVAPTANNGALEVLRWDAQETTGTTPNYLLIQFANIFGVGSNQIPPGSSISSATLTYTVGGDANAAGNPGDLREALVAWSEAETYNSFGGDAGVQTDEYSAVSLASMPGTPLGTYTITVTSSLTAWSLVPSLNRGWIVLPTGPDGVQVRSSEYVATPTERPKLTVTFSSPGQMCITVADCDDGNPCTNDACVNGTCTHTPIACNTGLFCSAKVCDPLLGCVFDHECISDFGNPCPDPATCNETTSTCGGCKQPIMIAAGSRYLAVTPVDQGSTPVALVVTGDCADPIAACVYRYVQSKCLGGPNNGQNCNTDADCPKRCVGGQFPGAVCTIPTDCPQGECVGRCDAGTLGSTPYYKLPSLWGTAKVRGAQIRPGTTYMVHADCNFPGGAVLSSAASAKTWMWGDVDHNGVVNAIDVTNLVNYFKGFPGPLTFEQVNLFGCVPDDVLNALDIAACVDAVREYAFPCSPVCP